MVFRGCDSWHGGLFQLHDAPAQRRSVDREDSPGAAEQARDGSAALHLGRQCDRRPAPEEAGTAGRLEPATNVVPTRGVQRLRLPPPASRGPYSLSVELFRALFARE